MPGDRSILAHSDNLKVPQLKCWSPVFGLAKFPGLDFKCYLQWGTWISASMPTSKSSFLPNLPSFLSSFFPPPFPTRNDALISLVWLLACCLPYFSWYSASNSGLFLSRHSLLWWRHLFSWFSMSSICRCSSTVCCTCTINFSNLSNCITKPSDGYLHLNTSQTSQIWHVPN